ncbi:hypothetical protein ACNQUF_11805, partial [Corynebacterium diphtheriae]
MLTLGRESAAYARLVELTRTVPRSPPCGRRPPDRHGLPSSPPTTRHFRGYDDRPGGRARVGPFPDLPPALVDGRRRLQQSVYEKAGICFAATSWVADSISDDYGIPREWITVTGLGVNREGQPSTDKDW